MPRASTIAVMLAVLLLASAASAAGGEGKYGARVVPVAPADEAPKRKEPRPVWVEHTVLPNETLEQIAARYGVLVRNIRRSNAGKCDTPLRSGTVLRIYARRAAKPRELERYTVKPGDDWVKIAVAHEVRYRALRGWNWQVGELKAGQQIDVWLDPDRQHTVNVKKGPPLPEIHVRDGGKSRGRPQKGWIDDAVRLPECSLYELTAPNLSWGSSHAVRTVLEAIADFRHESGFAGDLLIGAMSGPRGGKLPPHVSHRSGRDIDIFLPLLPHIPFTWHPSPFEIDWEASWMLVKSFVDTGQVELILLDRDLHRFLFEAGRQLGATPEELERTVQWPRPEDADPRAFVRHGEDHTRHVHVRIVCADDEDRCYGRWGDERHLKMMEADKRAEQNAAK